VTASCKKGIGEHKPEGGNESAPPAVTNVAVDNQPGQSVITYTLPADPNLLYVKAIYVLVSGQQAETKATYYSNSITIEGYADTLEHEVKLYSVSRTEITSPPVIVKIKPLESPIWKVFKSINIINAFGGYNLTAANPTKADIALLVFKKNVFNEYEVDNGKSVFTNVESILSKIRGLDTIDYRFGFMVRDKWLNRTDTLFKVIKPLYEAEFSSTKFRTFPLPGDAPQVTNGAALPFMWDGKFGWPYTSFTHQVNGGNGPHMITFDMGATGKVSRIWIRPFPEGTRYYYLSTMKRFEIYGSDNPSLTGALDNTWSLLGSYIVVKPSGQPYGTDSGADQETAAAGFNWEADLSAPKVRYIRIRCLENFAGGTAQSINEIKVYGDPR
jgi:hypothetical protein